MAKPLCLKVKLRGAGTRNFDVFEHKQAKRGLHKLSDVNMRMVKHTPGTYFISFHFYTTSFCSFSLLLKNNLHENVDFGVLRY